MGFKLKFDDLTQIALRRNLQKDGKAQQFLTNEIARLSDDYIPMDSGTLKNNKSITQHSITYKSPYAKRQWYENKGASGGHRGKEWCNRAIIDHKEELIESVAKFCGGKAK
ncbi:minor capsid protein [Clostridium sp. ZBS4]|uniref:minor capsid protein n=1 Tax=Clostridium sp. ZBS4 TaxID=2949974 RepID=UPI00207A31B6